MLKDTTDSIDQILEVLERMYVNLEDNCVDEQEAVEMPVFLFKQVCRCYTVLYHNNISKSKLQ